MTAIDNIINQIEGETQNRGNTKTRVSAVLRLLRDKIANLFSTKLDKGTYTGNAGDLIGAIGNKVDKVPGKMLSTNDFTNELRTKLEGLRQVDISGLLPKGGYTGTAQNLKELIDNIMRILQSPDTELDELREIVAYIKQNKRILDTLGISNIAGLQDALNGKAPTDHHHDDRYSRLGHTHSEYAYRSHRHNWDDIDGKPALATEGKIAEAVGKIQVGGRNLLLSSNTFSSIFWSYSKATYKGSSFVTPRGSQFPNEATKISFNGQEWNMFQKINFDEPGSYILSGWVKLETANNLLIVVNNSFSATAIFGKVVITGSGWQKFSMPLTVTGNLGTTFGHVHLGGYSTLPTGEVQSDGDILLWNFKLEKGNTPTDWTPAPEDFIVKNIETNSSIALTHAHSNTTIFLTVSNSVDLSGLENLDCVSFRKVFAGGNVTFTCTGKTIIYTGDNSFNGGDGSTAVVSVYGNKCYIDIRNV